MNIIYQWIGFAFFWLSFFVIACFVLALFYEFVMNWLGSKFKSLWVIIEFQFYKKEFKEWVKDKERHKNVQ